MKRAPVTLSLIPMLFSTLSVADDELAKVKERELEEVRERISELKQSMDDAARDRDRLTGELQEAEITIAEQRQRLKDLERERSFTEKRRAELDVAITEREAELEREAETLGSQLRAAYMSGEQERLKLLLNQQDPATLGRLMRYYRYLNDYRTTNIDTINRRIRELAELRSQVAAEEARLTAIAKERYAELAELNGAQEKRQSLLASVRQKIADEGREIDRLAASLSGDGES